MPMATLLLPLLLLLQPIAAARAPDSEEGQGAPYLIDSDAKNRTFDGVGALSGGGATTKLLPECRAGPS